MPHVQEKKEKIKDWSLCCYESANWILWSCSSLFHMKGQPRFFLFGKAWCCNKTDKCISCCISLTEEKTLLPDVVLPRFHGNIWGHNWMLLLNHFYLKRKEEGRKYTSASSSCHWSFFLKFFSYGFSLMASWRFCAVTQTEFTELCFYQRVSLLHRTQDLLNLIKIG